LLGRSYGRRKTVEEVSSNKYVLVRGVKTMSWFRIGKKKEVFFLNRFQVRKTK